MENQRYIDELDLKSCIKIIIKKRTLILTTLLLFVLILATPVLFEPKIYLATASITVTSNITHKVRLKSNLILSRIIQNLQLKDSSGQEETADALYKNLNTINAGQEGLTYLEARADKPERAKEIANTWVHEYIKYINEITSQEVGTAEDALSKQLEFTRAKLRQSEEDLLAFKRIHKLDLMKTELLASKNALVEIKRQLAQMEFGIKLKEITFSELKNQISMKNKRLSVYQDLEKRIVEDAIEINTFYTKAEYIKKSIETRTIENTKLDNDFLQAEFELAKLTQEVDFRQNEYHAFLNKMTIMRNDMADALGKIKIVSTAISPAEPVNQEKIKKTFTLTSVLGLMLGIFIAFCIEFWQKGKKENI